MPTGASELSPKITGAQQKLLCDTIISCRSFSLMDDKKVKHSSEVKEFMVSGLWLGLQGTPSPCVPLCKNIFISYIYMKTQLFAAPCIIQSMECSRLLEWVAIPFSRESSQPRDRTCVSCFLDGFFMTEPQGKPSVLHTCKYIIQQMMEQCHYF